MLTESDVPLKFNGKILNVVAELRREVEVKLVQLAAGGEWSPSVYGVRTYRDNLSVGAAVELWAVFVEDDNAVNALQEWIRLRYSKKPAHLIS